MHFWEMNATTSASRPRRGFRRSLRAPHSRHGDPRSRNGRHTRRGRMAYVERLIGPIRREALDHLIVFDETKLRRVLKNYSTYYTGPALIFH